MAEKLYLDRRWEMIEALEHQKETCTVKSTVNKAELIDRIHAMQDAVALCRTATYPGDWVIGMLSQIAQDVAALKPEETPTNSENNDQAGI